MNLLSPVEVEALVDAANGLTMDESAQARYVTREGVKRRRQRAMLKLGAKNITHACTLAMHRGVLPGLGFNRDDLKAVLAGLAA